MPISKPLYDKLKFLAQIVLPSLGTLYFTLAAIWGLPAAEQVVGTIVAVDTFLGVILQISSSKYDPNTSQDLIRGGTIQITEVGDKKVFTLELEDDPVMFEDKKEVVFRVNVNKVEDG